MAGCIALIVAAGSGHRFGGDTPKQYRDLAGRAVLRFSAETFLSHSSITGTRVVIHPDHRPAYERAVAGLELLAPVSGGATRQQSVLNGLESLAELRPDRVLIHDGARPFIGRAVIDRAIAALDHAAGAIVALPVVDTLKHVDGNDVTGTVDRQGLWRAQTPQAFRFSEILGAHRGATGRELTDDAAIAESAGLKVAVVMGEEVNFKITTMDDLRRAEQIVTAALEYRTGSGYDVHRFIEGDSIMLCGVRVPHSHGLEGHSDADAGLHALTDAILGAIAAGDIGHHFSPADPRWRGAESSLFLRHAADMVRSRGGRIAHVDITVICERPKIAPHRDAMVARIAEILNIAGDRVSVKATTTEGLGFTGRREGIAAQAIATIELPAGR
ncbi:MAG: bifunctional 2-C-methyl-D-erythritol 4-phosphate cytidylyltransferase/2-C-methyl-D-erythritol 2,4-cyclodiphosphate synthase [Dongiaceae bacterium]